MEFIKKQRTGSLFVSLAILLVGLFLVIRPGTSAVTICYLIGTVLTLSGLVKLIIHFVKGESRLTFKLDLIWSVIAMLFGVLLLIGPAWFLTLINQVIGVFILIEGLFAARSAIESKKLGMSAWCPLLVTAAASCLFGILLIVSLLGTNLLMIILGISFIISGLRSIMLTQIHQKGQ